MNNCFIDSVIKSLNNLNKFNELINNFNDLLFYAIQKNNSILINKLVFQTRLNNSQEDAEEFLTCKLLPKFKNYQINNNIKLIKLNDYELNIINEFIKFNKSKIFDFLKKYKYFKSNFNFYNYFYDFFDNVNIINDNQYLRNFNLADCFNCFYFDFNNNELIKSYIVSLNNNNFNNEFNNIFFLKLNFFLIININYVNDNNFIIPLILNNNNSKYFLKSIIYYMDFGFNSGHYYTVNINLNNNQNYNAINKNSKAKLLFFEKY